MGTAFDCVDVVDVGIYLLGIAGVVLEGYVDRDDLVGIDADGLGDELLGTGVEVIDEFAEAFFRIEDVVLVDLPAGGLALAVIAFYELVHHLPLVGKGNADALVEEGKFTETGGQGIVLVDYALREDGSVGMESDGGSVFTFVALPNHLHRSEGFALGILLHEHLALAAHFGNQEVGKGVDARYAHAVEASGYLVVALAELAARMQHGKHHFEGRTVLLGMHAGGDASAIVLHTHRVVLEDLYVDGVAEAGHGLVDTVVDHLIDQVMESAFRDVAYVHRRSLADRFESFEHLYAVCGILLFRLCYLLFVNVVHSHF